MPVPSRLRIPAVVAMGSSNVSVEIYVNVLFESFQLLADDPQVGQERGDLRP